MESERALYKQRDVIIHKVPVMDYVTVLSRFSTNDAERLTMVDATVEECLEKFQGETGHQQDYCLFSNKVGHALVAKNLHREASVAYQFAFDGEDPYQQNSVVYAGNFVSEAFTHLTGLGGQLTEHDKSWLGSSMLSLIRARSCLRHAQEDFWNEQGKENYLKLNGDKTDAEHFPWDKLRGEKWSQAHQAEMAANNMLLIVQSLKLT